MGLWKVPMAHNRLRAFSLLAALILAGVPHAWAHGGMDRAPNGLPGEFYIGQTTTTGFDTRFRAAGLERDLRQVLVRVSGDPSLARDKRVMGLVPDMMALIRLYSYQDEMAGIPRHDEQGTRDRPYRLTVQFYPEKIDALLARLGDKPWLEPRPTIVPVVLVEGGDAPKTTTYLVTREGPEASDARLDLARFALRYGVAIEVPSAAQLKAWGVATNAFPVVPSRDGQVMAGGTVRFRVVTLGWVGIWRMQVGNDIRVWSVGGVEMADALDSLIAGAVAEASGHAE